MIFDIFADEIFRKEINLTELNDNNFISVFPKLKNQLK